MELLKTDLKNKELLTIREAEVEDASELLEFVNRVGGESDFLAFGLDEFDLTVDEEENFLQKSKSSENQIFLLGFINNQIVATLNFAGGNHLRIQHTGEFGMSVAKEYWGMGIGSLMIDVLIDWAKKTEMIKKINLRVREDICAIHLYKKKGFKKEGTITDEIYLHGKSYKNLWMGFRVR